MKRKQKQKGKLDGKFFPMYFDTVESPAWLAMSIGARVIYMCMKRRYRRDKEEAVYLSSRDAAKELRADKNKITPWFRELQHYGFIVEVQAARLGSRKGQAPHYRLTDEPYLGQPASKEFTRWKGKPFPVKPVSGRTGHINPFVSGRTGHLCPDVQGTYPGFRPKQVS
jgi:hypothetical protein